MAPSGGSPIFLDLRRTQDTDAVVRGRNSLQFVVTMRTGQKVAGCHQVINKRFDTLSEARRAWCEQAMKLEDQGLQKFDFCIAGFHEED